MADRYWLTMRGVLDLDWPEEYRSRRGGLGNHAVVLAAIAGYTDAYGYAWPKMSTVATMIGVSDDTVSRIVEDLCEIGLLDRVRLQVSRNGNLANYLYRLPGAYALPTDELLLPDGFALAEDPRWGVDAESASAPGPGPRTGTGSRDPAPAPGQEVPNGKGSNEEGSNGSTAVAVDVEESPFPDVATEETIAESRDLCRLFAGYVKQNGHAIPTTRSARDGWLVEMERLVRIGPPGDVPWPDDPEDAAREIVRVMAWALSESSFWPANVRSVPKFREQFTRLRAQADRSTGTASTRSKYERLQREGLT